MRVEGADFLHKNAALAEEIRRTFVDIDEIEGQLKKAENAIDKAQAMTAKYRTRLAGLCDTVVAGQKKPAASSAGDSRAAGAGD
jgi:hypothetical protein